LPRCPKMARCSRPPQRGRTRGARRSMTLPSTKNSSRHTRRAVIEATREVGSLS
jgi:hypothetical protein